MYSVVSKNIINYGNRKQEHLEQDFENNDNRADCHRYCLRHTSLLWITRQKKRMVISNHPLLFLWLISNQVKLGTAGIVISTLFAQGTEADVTCFHRLVEEHLLRFTATFESSLLRLRFRRHCGRMCPGCQALSVGYPGHVFHGGQRPL